MTSIPTRGQMPGSKSLRGRFPDGDVILTACACYMRRTVESTRLPELINNAKSA